MAEDLTEMELPTLDEINHYQSLSVKLYVVMEDIGAYDERRKLMTESCTALEIIHSIQYQKNFAVYIFGSQYEGASTFDMQPDMDIVHIYNHIKLATDISSAPNGNWLVIVQDSSTPAGYAKLQLVKDGVTLLKTDPSWLDLDKCPRLRCAGDKSNRLVCYYEEYDAQIWPGTGELHGPALTMVSPLGNIDSVPAIQCKSWPDFALEWLSRPRNYNWPSDDLIDLCKSLGFIVVHVGHPFSDEQELQWRVSFSRQERLLVTYFTSVQLKCYLLLKLIKSEVLKRLIQEETLTSYHCKTCMFYIIESTPSAFWKPENLINCVIACLRMVLKWARCNTCPNYFIPGEIMFDRLAHGDLTKKLCQALEQILSSDFQSLLQEIQTGDVGMRLNYYETISPEIKGVLIDQRIKLNTLTFNKGVVNSICNIRNIILWESCSHDIEDCVKNLTGKISELKETVTITDHNQEETTAVVSPILTLLQPYLLSCTVALEHAQGRNEEAIWRSLTSNKWNEMSRKNDSSNLKQATIMFMFGHYSSSVHLLESLSKSVKVSVCHCDASQPFYASTKAIVEATRGRPDASVSKLLSEVLRPCVVFLPSEKDVTPAVISYEMIRSIGMPVGSRYESLNFWYDWAVVDGEFLLHFLLYLNHSQLGQRFDAQAVIIKMHNIINTKHISHKETCLNLLGWAHKKDETFDWALYCFRRSLKLQPLHNAAFWHLCFLICEILISK